jgi:putative MFS transporter
LQCDPKEIELPTVIVEKEKTRWRELFKYPRSMTTACLVALSQTGGVGILMWITTLFVMVLKITPAEASYLMIWVGILGIIGRLVASWMSDAFGRRASGFLIGMGGAISMALAGYFHDVYVGTVSVFFVLIMVQRFFGDASYAIIGPYIAEVWPNRLRASGMGFSYGIGNLGKVIGPLGLALIVGSSNYVSPKLTIDAIFPALLFLAFWYGQAGLVFLLLGIETKGRSIEEIGSALDAQAASPQATSGAVAAG